MAIGPIIVFGVPTAIVAIALAYHFWPRRGAGLFHHRYTEWLVSCGKRGLTRVEMEEEFLFRNSKARLRRIASERAIHAPENPNRIIAEVAAKEAEALMAVDPALAKRFIGVVDKAGLSDILYSEALRAVHHHGRLISASAQITDDNLAALKTVR
jgi:hypothetical protein